MIIDGIIEKIEGCVVYGWVRCTSQQDNVTVRLLLNSVHVGEAKANQIRVDLKSASAFGFGFKVAAKELQLETGATSKIEMIAELAGQTVQLTILRPIELARELSSWTATKQKAFAAHISDYARATVAEALLPISTTQWRAIDERKLCVICYANDNGAWFPYFYKYYASAVGGQGIYVVTPRPSAFAGIELGGVISCPNMLFDDRAKARVLSSLASGLQAYYEWTLVCDVDEILLPYPGSAIGIVEMLGRLHSDVSLSRGFDVVQHDGEDSFDTSKSICEQRSLAIPNSAICKPHVARVPIAYSGGHHYCDKRLDFEPKGLGFVTLHLKWACKKMRRSVATIVEGTQYTDREIEMYCKRSVADETVHPAMGKAHARPVELLDSMALADFEMAYANNLKYSGESRLWVGKHFVGSFFISIRDWQ